ncbi:hypothetical protein ACFFQF_22900 [Haladaptatus pallidirubidus]|uniref:Uncharacterized protein n=1 Tax=Haladaptatus pallidirubidus TaxID=1008152 RepID=A0AAV3UP54_9EURY|nr:hypothetical protein [Haladaptatus pallidirubidus]
MSDNTSNISIDEWITGESIPFDLDSSASLDAAIDETIAELGDAVELLGFGEPLHGGEAGTLPTYIFAGFVLTSLIRPQDTLAWIGNVIFALVAIGLLIATGNRVRKLE